MREIKFMEEGINIYFGILPLAVPLMCRLELLGQGFHTEIAGLPVKVGLPEPPEAGQDRLKAPQIVSRYDVSTSWGETAGDSAMIRTLFFGFQATEEEAERIWKEAGHWSAKLQNLCLLRYALPEDPEAEPGSGDELQIYRMCMDGSILLEHHRPEHILPKLPPQGAPCSGEELEELLEQVRSEEVIEQSYSVLLGACRAYLDGDDYTAGVLGGTAVEMASAKYITTHEKEAREQAYGVILEDEKAAQFEMLARLGLEIPGSVEDRIISVYGDMKYGRITPDHPTIRRFLEDCRQVMSICFPEYLIP